MKIEWIEYKGKKILYCDYRLAKSDKELISLYHKQIEILKNTPGKTILLANVGDTHAGSEYMNEITTVPMLIKQIQLITN